jgi:prephenate dehydrogenase
MEVLIVGAGDVGRWFATLLDGPLSFADIDPESAESAAAAVGARSVALDTDQLFDVVVFAVPLPATESAIETHGGKARLALVNLAGGMVGPTTTMANVAPERERLSLHPLFAPDNAPGRVAYVKDAPGEYTDQLLATLEAAGNVLIETTPEKHDRAMETVQARAHAAVLAFALAAESVPEGFGTPVYDGLQALVEEVTGGNPRVYSDIQTTFDGAEDIAEAATRIAEADPETFERLYRDAGK